MPANQHPKVQYLLSEQRTGWAAMAKEVRNFGEEKVRQCKEDIDTLLVCGNLFLAVLYAFSLAAYLALQPDRMDRIAYILERITAQTTSYTFNGTTTTATNMLPPSPSSVPAIR